MLRSYSAQLTGTELTWLEPPPVRTHSTRVLVVVEDEDSASPRTPPASYTMRDLAGRLQWRGDAVQAQRTQRDAW